MSSETIMDSVERRTNLALSNQMEMLTFTLSDGQLYGINVFKILTIICNPEKFTRIPGSPDAIIGTINHQGTVIPIIDLAICLKLSPPNHKGKMRDIIVCEYNNSIQGFLVSNRNSLLTKGWEEIIDPRAGGLQEFGYLTAVSYDNGKPIQILNIEDLLNDMFQVSEQVTQDLIDQAQSIVMKNHRILVVDDSKTARMMMNSVLNQLSVQHHIVDGPEEALQELEASLTPRSQNPFSMILSDIEMPTMDGFTFTRTIKADLRLAAIPFVLHSSMSNEATRLKAEQVGADAFIPKFQPDDLARVIIKYLGNDRENAS